MTSAAATTTEPQAALPFPGVKVRAIAMVSEALWRHFHTRWREINGEWLGAGTDGWELDVLSGAMRGISAARDALRAEVRMLAPSFPGPFLVPV